MNLYYGPPGTGKTTKLISIVSELLAEGILISRIAYISFSKRAILEAQNRLENVFHYKIKEAPYFRTLHSLAFKAVGASMGQMMNVEKYTDFGKKSGFSLKGYYNPDEGITSKDDNYIMIEQLYRNNRKYCEKVLDSIDHSRFVAFMQLYTKYKRTFNYLDFTDLLDLYIEKNCSEDVDAVILDEAQDFTTLQWSMVFRAFKNVKRMYIAGDDDQCIYQWGGAAVEIFLKLRGEAKVLDHSYRLPQNILNKGKQITDFIQNRIKKEYTGRDEEGDIEYVNELDEINIAEESTYLLARNNFLLDKYIRYCIKEEIPFLLKGHPYVTSREIQAVNRGSKLLDNDKTEYIKRIKPDEAGEDIENIKVNISTIHSVKGGEADHVVLMTDISKGVSTQLHLDEDSEHRVFYVGVTRARKKLTIALANTKHYYPYL